MSRHGQSLEFMEILERGGGHKMTEIAKELDISDTDARKILHQLRKRAIKGQGPWIHVTPEGYSLTTTPSAIIKEASMRIKMCVGIYVNSAPVFGKARKIASKQFDHLRIEHKPLFLKIGKLGD